jgi:hypothetical protein
VENFHRSGDNQAVGKKQPSNEKGTLAAAQMMKHGGGDHDSDGSFWTLQQFWTGPTGLPWYALQKQNDKGVIWGTTGYRHQLEPIWQKLGVTPQELPPISEEEYLRQCRGDMPD